MSGARFSFLMGDGAQALPRAHQLHARAPHRRARLHRGGAAVPRERGRADRHREPAEVRSGPLQDRGRLGSLPDPDRGGAADESPSRGDPRRPSAAAEVLRLHAVLPQRGRLVRRGRARPDPPAPVRQGGAGEVRRAGPVARGTRIADAGRRGGAGAPRPAVPPRDALHRRHGVRVGDDLRHRGVAAEPEDVPRDLLVQQHRGVPGAAREHQVPARREGQGRVRAHAERLGPRRRPHAGGDSRELPGEGRLGHHPGGAAAVHGRAGAHRALGDELGLGAMN